MEMEPAAALPLQRFLACVEAAAVCDGTAHEAGVVLHEAQDWLKAIMMLDEAEENARLGKHQYLSGVLHNVAKILTNESAPADPLVALQDIGFSSGLDLDNEGRADVEASDIGDAQSPTKALDASRPCNYLSAMLTYIAQVGDEVAAADPAPSEAQNYFAMLRQLPDALLLRLVVHWGCADATAERVAALLGCNLAEEEGTAVGNMSVLPILGALGSESRAPAQPSKLSMQLPAFSELHRVSPLRATLAAALAVLQRLNGLSGGSAPLLPGSFGEAAIGASPASHGGHHGDSRGASPPRADSSRNSSPTESPSSSSSDAASQSSQATSHASSEFAAVNGNGAGLQRRKSRVKEEEQLLLFALKHAENLEPLGRWIKLQLETNPALASVSEVAAEHCRTSAKAADPRRKANKLSQAGRWKEAVAMADRDGGASDALLTGVVDGVALQLMQDSMSDGRESTSSATMDATDDDQKFLWECCCRIKDREISARLVLRHLGVWELEQAIELLVMCQTHLPQQHSLQQELQGKLSCLTFCRDVLSHEEARLEMK
ncbi:hypothetical protein COCSUDRAFT_42321 [Coccomyxa subellipsoidea C-169]|uniref:Uncharacterized protein n=1 Tax=Coccomyxa subellipsoidea (strain C-169) TaxID=574566 RepID=I0YWA3_COCSC|nr:hypothetical protein COCSUDRAFT_42321 [Coccomyxa subellipsoidea C-169]EIE22672.1 hypothetical protein COCSUDRAFT_42321 [Coccomyxa subellipsoidea C-169]|eukprot:XP_005647216.1 hypothetical protein COCSUDRAFT_42321 [Coccomyxa subellipsoidea C-169]